MAESFRDDPNKMKSFRFEFPEGDRPRKTTWLARTDHLFAALQVISKGGEANLHSHSNLDGFWFVLGGRARFYSNENEVAAELGPMEGMLVPRDVKYAFESVGHEPLQILQVECSDKPMHSREELRATMKWYGKNPDTRSKAEYHDVKPVSS